MNKMTHKDYFNQIATLARENGRDDLATFAEERIAAIEKKAANKKPTKTQAENVALKERIAAVLTAEGQTVTEILTALATDGLSNQKVSSMLKQMEQDGIAVKTIDKRRSLYALAA